MIIISVYEYDGTIFSTPTFFQIVQLLNGSVHTFNEFIGEFQEDGCFQRVFRPGNWWKRWRGSRETSLIAITGWIGDKLPVELGINHGGNSIRGG